MKSEKILKRLDKSIANHTICQIWMDFDEASECPALPIRRSDNLLLYAPDGEALKNGYVIRKLDDVQKVKKTDTVVESSKVKEMTTDRLMQIDLTDLRTAMASIGEDSRVVVVECERLSKKEVKYAIGKIEKVGKNNLGIRYYGPDKEWEDRKWKIPYDQITRVTIGSGYTKILNNYVTDTSSAEVVEEVVDLPGQTLVQPE